MSTKLVYSTLRQIGKDEPVKMGETHARGDEMADKTCPKCADAPVMKPAPVVGMIPAKQTGELSLKIISDACGFPVRAYECPKCHLVELYREVGA